MPPDYDVLFALIPDSLFEISADGTYLSAHNQHSALYPYVDHPDGLLGRTLWEALGKDDADRVHTMVTECLRTKQLFVGTQSRTYSTGVRHYEIRMMATGSGSVLSLVRDTTLDKDRAETLQALYDAMPAVVCHVDANGRCIECHGHLHEERTGASGDPPGLPIAVRQLHHRALETDDIQNYRYSLGGAHYVARARRTRINTVVYVVHDETDQIKTLEELQRSNDSLQKFAYFASHDLQEPLRGMHGPAQILLDEIGPSLDSDNRKWLTYIHSNSERAIGMVRDMLEFSRSGTQNPKPELFDGDLAIREVIDAFRASIEERRATIVLKTIPHIYYDRVKFQAMIANLLSNGLKFRREGTDPVVEISGRGTTAHMVMVSVSDNGIGIPTEAFSKVLEPGQRLHHRDKYPGNGLGLSSVAMIIERCGGSLGIRSVVGRGSEFHLTLPGGIPHVE